MDDAITPEDPIFALILAYCPSAVRPAWAWLWTLQKRINDGVARVGEPVLGQMRIAWWRERILDAESLPRQRDPLLLELAVLTQTHSGLPDIACLLLDSIEARITAENPAQWAEAVALEGQVIAEDFAALVKTSPCADIGAAGRAFALARVLEHGQIQATDRREMAAAMAESALNLAKNMRLPRSLSIMRRYASYVIAAPNYQLRLRDGLKLIIHGLTRWPNR